ncbi:Chromosome-associated kinesin KIF4 [Toxocara canis]|uniref:Chromosome-associated kinesin KIF4 n=1 Tax=Toxocara canis TaxID=6265 RepID=A0A0B2VRU9_TOXCA|nr:Chromosome-associated kinesin KIF4 [Toxocara canis]
MFTSDWCFSSEVLLSQVLAIKVMGDIPVRVAVRVRPFSQREQAESARPCVSCYEENNQVAINGKMFAFDHVFDTGASQENVYEACALPMLECLFKGYNCTLLAYGQTGSGKTYTMGTEETSESMSSERRGIIARMVDAIFQQIGSSQRFKVSVSMLEIYEERVVDLLTLSRDGLQIREMNGAVFVQGLSCEKVDSLTATMNQLEKGCLLRSKGVTAMNNKSSRSHAIFTITIEKLFTEDGDDGCFKSKLHLVDLAGSERLKKTQAEGERMREGIKINEGLLALGNVIAALSESSTSNRHIPYRDSKITRLLQDSLGGNSYTVMIACISPADTNAEETLSTLRYADRTKRIKNKPIVNVDPSFAMVEALRNELAAAKHQIAILMTGQQPILVTSDAVAEKERLKRELGNSQDEIRRLNLCLAEEAVEKSHILESAFAATQALETLKQRLRAAFKGRAEESEILNVLDASLSVVEDQNTESVDKDKTEEEDGEESTADQIYVAQFAEKQSALSRELASLLDEIRNKTKQEFSAEEANKMWECNMQKNKERAYEATEQSSEQLAKMRAVHEAELEELQAKLAALEKERDELQAKLKGSSIHHKLSEERRKRLAELEKETECYRRRMMELKRIKKENSNLQERAKKLTQELLELKKLRVKMVRQMKDEEAKFRKWKLKADRELLQMKSRERKREVEAARAKQITAQQLAVYRRKYEEANACNRRLHQQLARGSSVRKQGQKDGDQLIAYFDNELEIAISAAEARWHCEVLIEQRKALAQQLRKKQDLRNKLSNEPPRKRRTGSNHSNFDDESEKHKLDQEIESLQQEIELRATEIHELQAKCINSDEREEQRWSVVGSLANAKITLKHLFDAVVNQRRAAFEKKQAIEEQMSAHEEETKMVEKEIRELKEALRREQDASKALRDHIARRELDLDETTMDLISSWDTALERNPDTFDVRVVKRLEKVTNYANRLAELQKTVQEQSQQIEAALQAQLAQREAPKRAKKTKENMASKRRSEEFDENDLEESLSFSDDPDDESYLPTPDRRRRNKKRAKRSHPQPCRSGPQTFVVETPFPSSSNAGDMNDQEEYKENNAQNGNEPSATMNTTYTIADDAPLPKSVLGTDPVELKTRRKNRPRKAVNSSISTPERRKQVEQMFANL